MDVFGHRPLRLESGLPGIGRQIAQDLVDAVHQAVLLLDATRGNIEVAINLVYLSGPVTALACPCLSAG